MDIQYIPEEILDNPNFDWDNGERIKEINNTFRKILTTDISVKGTKEYNGLIKEINDRHEQEMIVKTKNAHNKNLEDQLRLAKSKLQYLKKVNN